jgi:hypothetical protein
MRALPLAVLLLAAAAAPARAGVVIAATLSQPKIALDDQVVLAVTVSGDQFLLPEPSLPQLEAFSVYASGSNTMSSGSIGHLSSRSVYTYVLKPRQVGKFRIPAISAPGVAAPTAPLDIEVVATMPTPPPPAEPPSLPTPSPDPGAPTTPGGPAAMPTAPRRPAPGGRAAHGEVFVTTTLDKPRVLVNEQTTLTVRFYNAVQLLGNLSYDAPAMTGVLTEDLPPPRSGVTTVDGRQYEFHELKVALFPVQPGRITIGPASFHCQILRMDAAHVNDFFDRFFSMTAPTPITVASEPISFQVDALPDGKPADFSGVVGELKATVAADHTAVKAGDAVNLTVTVTGRGNLKTIPEPRKPDLPALRFFETESVSAVDKSGDRIGGSKTFRTVVVPRVSGEVRIPPFAFPYYDPQSKRYARAETAAVVLRVAPGAEGGGAAVSPAAPAAPGLTAIADDIRYLKTERARRPLSSALAAAADLGPLNSIPFAALALCSIVAWRRRTAEADPRGRRFRAALSRAEAGLTAAAALPETEAARAVALVDDALAGFVADKLDAPAAGLTLKSALDGLKTLPTPPSAATLERLRAVWEEADLRRFAPGAEGGDARKFAEDARAVLAALDAEVRR